MRAAELFDLSGSVALVTGASSGLGARFARVLAANGARVVAVARRRERLESLVADIADEGGEALAAEADVSDPAAMAEAFALAEAQYGTVDILVNNAGIGPGGRFADQPDSVWDDTMRVNLDAVHHVSRMAVRRMMAAGKGGSIINLASILSYGTSRGSSAYAVSKAAVLQLTRAMALELGRSGIRVNALAPGYFMTELTQDYLTSGKGADLGRHIPLGRVGQEGELDGALLLLASRASAFMTGACVVVDGGHMIGLKE